MEKYVQLREKFQDTDFALDNISSPTDCAKAFGGYLRPAERMDVVLTALEAMVDSSIYDKEAACSVMAVAMEDHAFWISDKTQIITSICKNFGSITTKAARHCLDSLLLILTSQMPAEEVRNLLKSSPPSDSNALDVWEVMLCMPRTLEKVLKELTKGSQLSRLVEGVTEDTCILFLALMAKSEDNRDFFGDLRHLKTYLKHPSVEMHAVVLRGLVKLSETREKARRMQVVLPEIMATLQDASTDVKIKALFVIQNIMGHVKRKEASSIAVRHAEELLPLFVDESSAVQVSSICLYRDMVQAVRWCHWRRMKGMVRRGLVPLLFRMSDENQDVAQAAKRAIVQTANLLCWNDLRELAEKKETWRIVECLLQRDQSRVEEYLQQSQPYLQDSQAALREEAVRFIGLAARYLRDQSEEKLQDIIGALRPLASDTESSVQCLAAQTTLILGTTMKTGTSRRSLRALCCLFC
ncbi:maestro heat-like repeat-containing protein family member 7 [Excalfactoria chinensis]|uniref:maestro heat-like repeat-containing protein family member 7 n=1 Tax=Excalfactoria chinensis TaxID=46218 RepID=UPI003B3B3DA7